VLSPVRRRRVTASLVLTGALAAGFASTTLPAQASPVATTATTSVAVAAPATVTTQSAAQVAATAAASARAARVAAAHRAAVVRAARITRLRARAVHVARTRLGSRYVAGHSGPRKFDCSGLALYVVKHSTGRSLPHYSKAQYRATARVSRSHLRAGDLVFFFRHGAHHVGIYIGRGLMINATNPHGGVRVDRVFSGWYGSHYTGAGRLV
jgi:cell wall-associated NlpC family hydrolase